MTVQWLKKYKRRSFLELWSKEHTAKEISITITESNIDIHLTTHQCGVDLDQPYVDIRVNKNCTYSMTLAQLLKLAGIVT